MTGIKFSCKLFFAPDHLVDNGNVALNKLDYNVRDILADIDVDGSSVIVVPVHLYGGVDCLKQTLFVYARKDETCIVKALGALGRGADTDCRERMTDRREETGFFWQCAGVGNDGSGVHLQAVVVVKPKWLMTDYKRMQLETALLKPFAAAGMTAVDDWHLIFLSDGVDGVEKRSEILLGVNVLFAMSAEKNIFPFLETETFVNIARLYVREICM